MLRGFKVLLILPIFLSVCSCSRNETFVANMIKEGSFSGVNSEDEKQMCYFNIVEIGPTEFLDANWINVTQDVVSKKLYRLEFYIIDSFNKKIPFDLINFKCNFIDKRLKYVHYRDDNKINFIPKRFDDQDYEYLLYFDNVNNISCSCDLYKNEI